LEKLNLNAVLAHTAQKSKNLDERFEEHVVRNLGFGKGEQKVNENMKMTFKTFLN
jgi:hypothetical protein